ncbi:MAG: DUF2079 domain-containing protein [Saprospiraceae bacterium]
MIYSFKLSKHRVFLGLVLLIFGIVYSSISLVNHYFLRTYALDLGVFNHSLYSYAHFENPVFTLNVSGVDLNSLGDHFTLITAILAPLYYIFGSYTLLYVQIASILLGGLGVYKYSNLRLKNYWESLLVLIHFFLLWGIYFALSYDFHTNVLAAMFVPWLVYYYEKDKKIPVILFFLLILICKENMALWAVFIILGLSVKSLVLGKKKLIQLLQFEFPLMLFAAVYFVVVVGFIMPSLLDMDNSFQLAKYSMLGDNLSEIINTIITDPLKAFTLLFESPLNDMNYYGIKSELHFMVLISGGFLLFYRPYYLLMLIPIYAQKMFTEFTGIWGVTGQYSIEFAPILSLALIEFLYSSELKLKFKYVFVVVLIFITGHFTMAKLFHNKTQFYTPVNAVFYNEIHYKSDYKVDKIKEKLKEIPDDVDISVNSAIASRLAFRKNIYHFPVIKDSKYIVYLKGNPYPISHESTNEIMDSLIEKGNWIKYYDQDSLLILKKE